MLSPLKDCKSLSYKIMVHALFNSARNASALSNVPLTENIHHKHQVRHATHASVTSVRTMLRWLFRPTYG